MLIMTMAIMMITTMMMYAIFCRTGYTIKINVISKKKLIKCVLIKIYIDTYIFLNMII